MRTSGTTFRESSFSSSKSPFCTKSNGVPLVSSVHLKHTKHLNYSLLSSSLLSLYTYASQNRSTTLQNVSKFSINTSPKVHQQSLLKFTNNSPSVVNLRISSIRIIKKTRFLLQIYHQSSDLFNTNSLLQLKSNHYYEHNFLQTVPLSIFINNDIPRHKRTCQHLNQINQFPSSSLVISADRNPQARLGHFRPRHHDLSKFQFQLWLNSFSQSSGLQLDHCLGSRFPVRLSHRFPFMFLNVSGYVTLPRMINAYGFCTDYFHSHIMIAQKTASHVSSPSLSTLLSSSLSSYSGSSSSVQSSTSSSASSSSYLSKSSSASAYSHEDKIRNKQKIQLVKTPQKINDKIGKKETTEHVKTHKIINMSEILVKRTNALSSSTSVQPVEIPHDPINPSKLHSQNGTKDTLSDLPTGTLPAPSSYVPYVSWVPSIDLLPTNHAKDTRQAQEIISLADSVPTDLNQFRLWIQRIDHVVQTQKSSNAIAIYPFFYNIAKVLQSINRFVEIHPSWIKDVAFWARSSASLNSFINIIAQPSPSPSSSPYSSKKETITGSSFNLSSHQLACLIHSMGNLYRKLVDANCPEAASNIRLFVTRILSLIEHSVLEKKGMIGNIDCIKLYLALSMTQVNPSPQFEMLCYTRFVHTFHVLGLDSLVNAMRAVLLRTCEKPPIWLWTEWLKYMKKFLRLPSHHNDSSVVISLNIIQVFGRATYLGFPVDHTLVMSALQRIHTFHSLSTSQLARLINDLSEAVVDMPRNHPFFQEFNAAFKNKAGSCLVPDLCRILFAWRNFNYLPPYDVWNVWIRGTFSNLGQCKPTQLAAILFSLARLRIAAPDTFILTLLDCILNVRMVMSWIDLSNVVTSRRRLRFNLPLKFCTLILDSIQTKLTQANHPDDLIYMLRNLAVARFTISDRFLSDWYDHILPKMAQISDPQIILHGFIPFAVMKKNPRHSYFQLLIRRAQVILDSSDTLLLTKLINVNSKLPRSNLTEQMNQLLLQLIRHYFGRSNPMKLVLFLETTENFRESELKAVLDQWAVVVSPRLFEFTQKEIAACISALFNTLGQNSPISQRLWDSLATSWFQHATANISSFSAMELSTLLFSISVFDRAHVESTIRHEFMEAWARIVVPLLPSFPNNCLIMALTGISSISCPGKEKIIKALQEEILFSRRVFSDSENGRLKELMSALENINCFS